MSNNQPITPTELTASYNNEVRNLTLSVLEELNMLYTNDDEFVERYYERIYHFLSVLGLPELYRENPRLFDEKIFDLVYDLIERKMQKIGNR